MDFYKDWKNVILDIEKSMDYMKRFLAKDEKSLDVFLNGTRDEITEVCKFLLNIPLSSFIYCIDKDIIFTSDMIFQYSNLNNALIDTPRILRFSENSLTYAELGKKLNKAKELGASNKYGENHAKLAKEMSMVYFEKVGSIKIRNTAFGNFSVDLIEKDRMELIKRLSLRNEFVKKIIFEAKKGIINYNDLALMVLSKSTTERRKSNVKKIMSLILKDNILWDNILW